MAPIGAVVGLALSAPLGPVNIICINRTLTSGFAMGALAASGALVADLIFAIIAAFGLRETSRLLMQYSNIIQWVGGPILIIIGLMVFFRDPTLAFKANQEKEMHGLWQSIATTFAITITNPGALVLYIAAFAGVAQFVQHQLSAQELIVLVASFMFGATMWWIILAGFVSRLRHQMSAATMRWLNVASAGILIFAGVYLVVSVVLKTTA